MEILKEELTILWEVVCPKCKSEILNKNGKYRGRQRFVCLDCGCSFTTYSRSILDSTKLKESEWQIIIDGVISNDYLKTISEKSNVSQISISKIRRNILTVLYGLNRFEDTLNKYYYNPFDTSTVFIPNQQKGSIYFYDYNDKMVLCFIELKQHIFISKAYPKKEFSLLISSVHYPKLEFESMNETTNTFVIQYFEQLLQFLKNYRGIKNELLSQYCNFYDFQSHLNKEELTKLIIHQINHSKKRNG
jgi:transposase-like protein